MTKRATRLAVGVALAAALVASAAQAAPALYRAPRNAQGQPDLQGIWTNASLTLLQRPPIFKGLVATDAEEKIMQAGFRQLAGSLISTAPIDPNLPAPEAVKEAPQADVLEMPFSLATVRGEKRSSWIVEPANGRLPFTDAGRAATKAAEAENTDGPEGRPLAERCLTAIGSPEGPPMMNTGFNANYQIVQSPGFVTILVEMNHDARIVRMGDRRHAPPQVTPWMGDSVGWWEGETLVVETTNLNPRGTYVEALGGGFAYSPKARVVERFTRTAPDTLLYEFTVDDPATFKTPWRAEMPMRAAEGPIYEYACHEGNYSLPNVLQGARAEASRPAPAPATDPQGAKP